MGGVGVTGRSVKQAGDDFEVRDWWPLGSSTLKFRVDAGEQETVGRGFGVLVTPTMEHGYILHLVTQVKDRSTVPNAPVRYYFDGDDLVIDLESPSGRHVKYFHTLA